MEEKIIISTIKKVMPSVVSIVISKHLEDLEREMPHKIYPFLHNKSEIKKFRIPKSLIDEKNMIETGGGSGFIADPSGLVLTNKHVVSDAKAEYTVITNDDKKFKAKLMSRDPISDVAILKIDGDSFHEIKLGNSLNLKLGQSAIAIGNALGIFKNTVSFGIISGLSRSITAKIDENSPPQEMRGLIQTDAAINPGNSGGPLVDIKGRAIGINTAIVSGAQSIGFAIPINPAKRDIKDIKKYGKIKRPLLGVRYIIVDSILKEKLNIPVNYGALIVKEGVNECGVIPNSPAEKAGLKEGDIILKCNSRKIDMNNTIQDVLENLSVGEKIELVVLKKRKKIIKTKTVLAERF